MEQAARTFGITAAALATAVATYMTLLVAGDAAARYILAGDAAQRFAAEACARIAGCRSLRTESGYDWRNARRRIVHRLEMDPPGTERGAAAALLTHLASQQTGLLGWALRADPMLDVRSMPGAGSAAKPKKVTR